MSDTYTGPGTGETNGSRQAIDRVTGTLVRGGMPPEQAAKKARDLARDWDRKHGRS